MSIPGFILAESQPSSSEDEDDDDEAEEAEAEEKEKRGGRRLLLTWRLPVT